LTLTDPTCRNNPTPSSAIFDRPQGCPEHPNIGLVLFASDGNSRNLRRTMSRSRPAIDLSSHLIDPASFTEPGPLNWADLFANHRPVELEIGSGKGLFLLNAAMADPTHDFLGIELSRKYARLAAERLAKQRIPNAKVWPGDARIVLPRHIPPAGLQA